MLEALGPRPLGPLNPALVNTVRFEEKPYVINCHPTKARSSCMVQQISQDASEGLRKLFRLDAGKASWENYHQACTNVSSVVQLQIHRERKLTKNFSFFLSSVENAGDFLRRRRTFFPRFRVRFQASTFAVIQLYVGIEPRNSVQAATWNQVEYSTRQKNCKMLFRKALKFISYWQKRW